MMLILRLEDAEGRGVYNSPYLRDVVRNIYGDHAPTPWSEVCQCGRLLEDIWFEHSSRRRINRRDYIFGFSSAKQLTRWFSEENLHQIQIEGGYLCGYTTHPRDVVEGEKQVIFIKNLAVKRFSQKEILFKLKKLIDKEQ